MSERMRSRLILAASALLVAVVLVATLVARRRNQVVVTTAEVSSGPISRQVLATGTLEPTRTVEVGSQVSGTIAALPVDFNAIVHAGDVVARLDPAQYESQLESARAAEAQARADTAQARAALEQAQANFDRASALASRDLVTPADLETTRAALDQARADVKAREAAISAAAAGVKQAQVDLERTVIRSPSDGVVVNRAVDVGQTVAASFQAPVLLTIADLRQMQLLTEVNEGEVGGIRQGSPVTFQVDSLGPRVFNGRVETVRLQPYAEATSGESTPVATSGTAAGGAGSSSAGSTTGTAGASGTSAAASSTTTSTPGPAAPGAVTYTAVIDVDNSDGQLAPGTTAVVTIGGPERHGVTRVPNAALSFRPTPELLELTGQEGLAIEPSRGDSRTGGSEQLYVWQFVDGRFVAIAVDTGLSDDHYTEIRSGGVAPGDALVTAASVAPR